MAGGAADVAAAVQGAPRALLRLEGVALLAGASLAYQHLGGGWGLFAAAFLLPDLALLAYAAGPRWGARAYNLAHSTTLPIALLAAGGLGAVSGGVPAALIWLAHIGLDRALGFGLKYDRAFGDTHLGRVGAAARRTIAHGQHSADR